MHNAKFYCRKALRIFENIKESKGLNMCLLLQIYLNVLYEDMENSDEEDLEQDHMNSLNNLEKIQGYNHIKLILKNMIISKKHGNRRQSIKPNEAESLNDFWFT